MWINIPDFLDAVQRGEQVERHRNERALAKYSVENSKIFPRRYIKEGSPLRALLAHIL